jgi:hypothetical protein
LGLQIDEQTSPYLAKTGLLVFHPERYQGSIYIYGHVEVP